MKLIMHWVFVTFCMATAQPLTVSLLTVNFMLCAIGLYLYCRRRNTNDCLHLHLPSVKLSCGARQQQLARLHRLPSVSWFCLRSARTLTLEHTLKPAVITLISGQSNST